MGLEITGVSRVAGTTSEGAGVSTTKRGAGTACSGAVTAMGLRVGMGPGACASDDAHSGMNTSDSEVESQLFGQVDEPVLMCRCL